jgi:hypothetical protein
MARIDHLRLKVVTDTADAAELAPRVKAAALSALKAADVALLMLDAEAVAESVAVEVMAEILRVRQATPAESAQARAVERVRALHRDKFGDGSCAECTHEFGVPYPCPTIRALDGQEQPGA